MLNTLFTGQNLIELTESPSVNTHAIELLKAVKLPEGTVICTKKQTQGRGQRGNTWLAEHGKNLTMCIVYHPNFLNAGNSFLLSMTVSLALYDLLTDLLSPEQKVMIKWPNDIYVDGKKIAGILIENILREDQIISTVIGIGLNINQQDFGGLNEKANSLKLIAGNEFSVDTVMEKLCSKTEARYLKLKFAGAGKIKEEYLSHLLYLGTEREFSLPNGDKIRGWISDVSENGRLLLQIESGGEQYFSVKELIF
ncbi:MAG: biotin--[acetyl-CoA-carboxylase] ligase [Bacteroidia bacterium]|nr:biotin--[acetyl-CoA-carboxylase] ligase [Bacteroidia bacterium]